HSTRRIWGPCHARVLNVWRPDCRNQSWSGQLEKAIRTCTPIVERPRMRRPRNVCGGHELPTTRILSGFFVLAMGFQPGGKGQEHRHRVAAAFLERSGLERVEQTLDLRGRNELVQPRSACEQCLAEPRGAVAGELDLPVALGHGPVSSQCARHFPGRAPGKEPRVEMALPVKVRSERLPGDPCEVRSEALQVVDLEATTRDEGRRNGREEI